MADVSQNKFNERFYGIWKSDVELLPEKFVSVFIKIETDNTGKDITLSYSYDKAYFINLAIYTDIKENSLYFYHFYENDENRKGEYILDLKNDNLMEGRCSLNNFWNMTGTFTKNIYFSKLSDEEVKKYKYKVMPKNQSRLDILREYANYGNDKLNVQFEFKFDERENMLDIIKKYSLDELVKDKNDVETAIALMNWLRKRYTHGFGLSSVVTPQALMEYADKNNGKTNCRGLSLILTQLIRAYHIKAFVLTCFPYEVPHDECHAIVSTYSETLNKWVMLDPACDLFFTNENDEVIGVNEFRKALINDKELIANEGGKRYKNFDAYRQYMAKNLIRLERKIIESYGRDGGTKSIVLLPLNYYQNEAKALIDEHQENFTVSEKNFWKI